MAPRALQIFWFGQARSLRPSCFKFIWLHVTFLRSFSAIHRQVVWVSLCSGFYPAKCEGKHWNASPVNSSPRCCWFPAGWRTQIFEWTNGAAENNNKATEKVEDLYFRCMKLGQDKIAGGKPFPRPFQKIFAVKNDQNHFGHILNCSVLYVVPELCHHISVFLLGVLCCLQAFLFLRLAVICQLCFRIRNWFKMHGG